MIAIKFNPIYEDRVAIFLKNSNLKIHGITWDFKDNPFMLEERSCFWLIDYKHSKYVNTVLSDLREMKGIMGVDDLEFSYCQNEREYYTQYSDKGASVPWFKV